jgi:phosphoglycolate phosphatase-like HAD superfamily hydrolase
MQSILFDFDGVILDSLPVREYGFRQIFASFEKSDVDALIDFHNRNGGLSRYVKIKYFFEQILRKNIAEEDIVAYAEAFSRIMKKRLVDRKYLVVPTMRFIEGIYEKIPLHIVSGSDGDELRYLCKKLGIDHFFVSIEGSPVPKNELVNKLLQYYDYDASSVILIGDSINDYDAAVKNHIGFYGFNNEALKKLSADYIDDYGSLNV